MTGSRTPVDNALNPAWRDSVVHIVTSQSWDESLTPAVADQVVHNMTYQKGYSLRQLTPDTGAYFNEVRLRNIALLMYAFVANDYISYVGQRKRAKLAAVFLRPSLSQTSSD
jgi:hypothetical protein